MIMTQIEEHLITFIIGITVGYLAGMICVIHYYKNK